MKFSGAAHVYGDNIDTDRIIPGKYTKTLDLSTLADHVLEDLDPEFRHKVKEGDILVAGKNFGCGSSREQAPLAIKKAGIAVVIAEDFARIFYRNAINIGLPIVEIGSHTIQASNQIEVDVLGGKVTDNTADTSYKSIPLPSVMVDILKHGGLIEYLKTNKDYKL